MKPERINGAEFKRRTLEDPSWCAKLTAPLEIMGYCNMDDSPITHLSPLLRFMANPDRPEETGESSFQNCRIKLVAGRFEGRVEFNWASIEEIHPDAVFTTPDQDGVAAYFNECTIGKLQGTYHGAISCVSAEIREIGKLEVTNVPKDCAAANFEEVGLLKVARGKFAGFVEFCQSSIEEIDGDPETGLVITQADTSGNAASFNHCPNLKIARGHFAGCAEFRYSGVEKIDTDPVSGLHITGISNEGNAADFHACTNLQTLEGNFPGPVVCSEAGITKVNRKTFRVNPNPAGLHCILSKTPLLKTDPVLAAKATFGFEKSNLELLDAALHFAPSHTNLCETIIKGVDRAMKARKAMKSTPDIEI